MTQNLALKMNVFPSHFPEVAQFEDKSHHNHLSFQGEDEVDDEEILGNEKGASHEGIKKEHIGSDKTKIKEKTKSKATRLTEQDGQKLIRYYFFPI